MRKVLVVLFLGLCTLLPARLGRGATGEGLEVPDTLQAGEGVFQPKSPHETVEEFGVGKLESVRLNEDGTVYSIYGDINRGITATDPVEQCYQLLELHKDLFGLVNPREEMQSYRADERVVKLQQYHLGLKVQHGGYNVHFRDGKLTGLNGHVYPQARQVHSATPTITKEQAFQIAKADILLNGAERLENTPFGFTGEPLEDVVIKEEDVVLGSAELLLTDTESGGFVLAWELWTHYFQYFIDASTGRIIKYYMPIG